MATIGYAHLDETGNVPLAELGNAPGGAPATATYIVQTADGTLSNEQILADLATGIVKNTTTTGVLSIAVAGTDYVAPDATLTALAAYNTNGLLTQTAADTFTGRTITGTANQITVTNGDGVSGNPTLSIPYDLNLGSSATGPSQINFFEDTDNGSNKVTLVAPASVASDKIITLQDVTGTVYVTGGTDVAVADGGTGASTAADARTNLGLAIGTNVQAFDATLSAFAAYNTNGLLTQTAADTFTGRTLTGTANRITVTNGDGVSGNPTVDIHASYVGQNTITTLGTITTGVWTGTDIAVADGGTGSSTAAGARVNLLPTLTGNTGKVLAVNGTETDVEWVAASGGAPATAQYVTLATDGTLTNERVLTGTANRITITDNGAGSTVVLATPQDIATSSNVTFGSLTLPATGSGVVATGDAVLNFTNTTGDGYGFAFTASNGTTSGSSGGNFTAVAGDATLGNAAGGYIDLAGGQGKGTGLGGGVFLSGGLGGDSGAQGGAVDLVGGASTGSSTGGRFLGSGGNSIATGPGGFAILAGGHGGTTSGNGGPALVNGGNGRAGNGNGGDVRIAGGNKHSAGTDGKIYLYPNANMTFGAIMDVAAIASSHKTVTFTNQSGTMVLANFATVASANDLTVTAYTVSVTGTTQINAITTTGWASGTELTLIFAGALTVKHNTAGGAGTAKIFLSGSADLTTAANTVLGLVYDGTQWQETFRKAA